MEALLLARLQFAATTVYHFLFVPLSIGLAFIIAIMETIYVVKGKEEYKDMAKFWGKLFLINFAIGVVTGIIQEFQFGMNWSDYSRFVGDVFGAPLAVEALLAFFMESTFIGVWIFGWNRLSKKMHLAAIWLTSIGTALSAFWILAANSFMQHPVGYTINNGRAEMNDFLAVITNGQVLVEYPHVIFASLATAAFLITGVSAWKLLKKQDVDFFKKSFKLGVIFALIGSIMVAVVGHWQAQYLVKTQPMKMAASEGLWETSEDPAPWTVFAVIDPVNQENSAEIKIPGMLSFMSYGKLSGSLPGMKDIQAQYEETYGPGNYIPPVRTTFWSFRLMILSGVLMIILAAYGTYLAAKNKLGQAKPWFLRAMFLGIFLPHIANFTGWLMTEIGRQPWTVQGLMTTADAVSPSVSGGEVLFSLLAYLAIYTVLMIVMIYLFVRVIKNGPREVAQDDSVKDPFDRRERHAVS
ncbi:MAG: cytochrome ubiquinol oxidase subunit I [Thermoactinomyces sp.]